ncbi:TetR/AcrR family transcriptional regulator [Streptomyces sp. NPDC059605]|uniref:TetR/AcrR family transcriptional regulator n=1 Tax=unclassified Streptomyces TaxID=2593676 RepID=UPI00369F94DA
MARRAQGTSAGLDRERIAAAVALVDRDGPERFGVRRLAQELEVDPMSIYHRIKGKGALLDAMSEAVLAEVAAATGDDAFHCWEENARRTAHGYREMAYQRPQVFPLLVTRAQASPAAISALEELVTAMREAGLPDQMIADVPMVLFGFLNDHLLARTSDGPGPSLCPRSTPPRTPRWPRSARSWPSSDPWQSLTGCSTQCLPGSRTGPP